MGKMKSQGTSWESEVVKDAKALEMDACRIAEGGSEDEGDVEIQADTRWLVECKARQNLNIQETLAKAIAKGKQQGHTGPVAVVWKRLVKVAGNSKRTPVAGIRAVAIVEYELWLDILRRLKEAEK
jgi:hypothetical protein